MSGIDHQLVAGAFTGRPASRASVGADKPPVQMTRSADHQPAAVTTPSARTAVMRVSSSMVTPERVSERRT